MSQYQQRQHPGHGQECPPQPDPAPQPHPPTKGEECEALPTTTPPEIVKPTKCPDPVPPCECPAPPGSSSNCLETLIADQAAQIAAAEKAKTFKADLETLLGKAKAAGQEYNRDKYDGLVKRWVEADAAIAELIRKLVCAVPCWRCIIECHVCPLLNELHYAEQWLYATAPAPAPGTTPPTVPNLHDLLYWHTRDKEAKERRFLRIKKVVEVWTLEKPAQTIDRILGENQKLIETAGKLLGSTDASKAVYDVFLRLVPLHLAIAPPKGSAWTTKIAKEYTEFCGCDTGTKDDCCGPDVGEWGLRQRLIGPQPYLIDPNAYFDVICCLVEKRYAPAKDALAEAEAKIVTVDGEIKRYKALLTEERLKALHQEARAAIPSNVDCCDYETATKPPQTR